MFQKKGYQIFGIKNHKGFNFIHGEVIRLIKKKFKFNGNLNQLHKYIPYSELNNLRIFLFEICFDLCFFIFQWSCIIFPNFSISLLINASLDL